MSSEEWYYAQNGQRVGPVAIETIKTLLSSYALRPEDYVWHEGLENWQPAGTLPELATPVVAAPPPSVMGYANPPGYAQPFGGATSPGMMGYYTPSSYTGAFPGYAGFWLRFAAYIIDAIIVQVGMFIIGFVIGLAIGVSNVSRGSSGAAASTEALKAFMNCFALIVSFLYYAMQESSSAGATLGKRVVGIRVTNEQGGQITFGQATGRFFGKIVSALILLIGFMMAGWTQRKQALHDMMAGTLVVRT